MGKELHDPIPAVYTTDMEPSHLEDGVYPKRYSDAPSSHLLPDAARSRPYQYPRPSACAMLIEQEIQRLLRDTVKVNALGPDSIPNLILTEAFPVIGRYLTGIY